MKSTVADYRYKIYCIRIVTLWGGTVYLTAHPKNITMGGHTYKTDSGYQFSGQISEVNMSPGVVDLNGIANISGIGYDKVISGVFDNARVYAFATTWKNPIEDEEPLGVGFMGKTTIDDRRFTVEVMMMIDMLNQTYGQTYSPLCFKKFGGQEYAGCKIALGPITVTGTITSVTSNSIFIDSARTESDDYFGNGIISFTSGLNAGLKPIEIKDYLSNGTITTHESFYYNVAIGDTYTMIPGCRKRKTDCFTKWNNIVNFGGFSFIPVKSTYAR
jgi:uncharacterized phage protein (TIGR02218 family)